MRYEIKIFAVDGKKKEWLSTSTRHKWITVVKIISLIIKTHRGDGDYDFIIEQRETDED